MKKQMTARAVLLISSAMVMMGYQNCSQIAFQSISANEAAKLGDVVFDMNDNVAGVEGADGQPSENLRVTNAVDAAASLVKDCSLPVKMMDGSSVSRFEYERSQAIKAAIDDPQQKTIPVQFAMSFGQLEDRLAYYAHKRAILSEGNSENTSVIPVGQRDQTRFIEGDKSYAAYYKVDHTQARDHYIHGTNCFFDTVKINGSMVKSTASYYDFISSAETDGGLIHMAHYMMYGWCAGTCATAASVYGAGNYGADTYPNRLFGAWPHNESGAPQIVKLYVADLRDGQFGLSTATSKIVKNAEGSARGTELQMNVKNDLDIKTMFRNRDLVIWNLSNVYKSPTGQVFNGMRGVPQLISNLSLAGASGTVLASQYTPIVVDLGAQNVKTSGVFAGSFFNMSSKSEIKEGGSSYDFTQQTAWLSGDLVSDKSRLPASVDSSIVSNYTRKVEDGFLVLADENGQVTSTRQMLGDKTVVGKKSYTNGFEALQALAKKDCTSADPKNRYLGPWDGALYSKTIQVWIDANRNGVVDSGELKTLADAGVVALNACNIIHSEAQDAFGNGTSLRSAFLYNERRENLTGKETEILSRLATGKTSTGDDASFRLAIDLVFKVNEAMNLE